MKINMASLALICAASNHRGVVMVSLFYMLCFVAAEFQRRCVWHIEKDFVHIMCVQKI